MNIKQFIYLLLLCFYSCSQPIESNENLIFKLPQVSNSAFDSTKYVSTFEANHISEVFPTFAGKYKFQDEIDLNPEKRDTSFC